MLDFESLSHRLSHPPEERPSLWGEGIIPAMSQALLHGDSKIGKSVITLNLAILGAIGGQKYLGHALPPEPFTTVILQGEISDWGVWKRADMMVRQMSTSHVIDETILNRIIINSGRHQRLSDKVFFDEFTAMLRYLGPTLVMLDPTAHVIVANENDNALVGVMLEKIFTWRDNPGCSIYMIHHNRKKGGEVSLSDGNTHDSARGAGRFIADADAVHTLDKLKRESCGPAVRITVSSRYGRSIRPFCVRLDEDTLWFERFTPRGDLEALVGFVADAGGRIGLEALCDRIEREWDFSDPKNHKSAKSYIKRAVEERLLTEESQGDEPTYTVRGEQ